MTQKIRIERLTPARRDDFLHFFDHERGPAFADNPEWAKCYCHFYHVPRAIDWESLDGGANRTAMTARIEAAEMDGFLAYAGDDVVGWVNAQALSRLPHCMARMGIPAPRAEAPPESSAVIVCFVIAPAWRRRGVARALLAGPLASFAERGIHVVDAFPFKSSDSSTATDHYHGPLSLYREAGFDVLAEHKNLTVMRKRLDRPH